MNKEQLTDMIVEVCETYSIHTEANKLDGWLNGTVKRLVKWGITLQEFESVLDAYFIKNVNDRYKTLPTPADIAVLLGKAPKSIEDMANEEMTKAFNAYTGVYCKFEHPVTNYVVAYCCGGLDNFTQEYMCKHKEDKTSVPFRKKEFIKDWIMCYENENYYYGNLRCGGYIPASSPNIIESTQKLSSEMLLENNRTEASDVVLNIAHSLKTINN
jgi:hypothetical protein